jgi:hypothetical protein
LLTNCADAILAKSAERNGAHGDEPVLAFIAPGGSASSLEAFIGRIISSDVSMAVRPST